MPKPLPKWLGWVIVPDTAKTVEGDICCEFFVNPSRIAEEDGASADVRELPGCRQEGIGFVILGLAGTKSQDLVRRVWCFGHRCLYVWRRGKAIKPKKLTKKEQLAAAKKEREERWARLMQVTRLPLSKLHSKPHPFFVRDAKVKPAPYRKPKAIRKKRIVRG